MTGLKAKTIHTLLAPANYAQGLMVASCVMSFICPKSLLIFSVLSHQPQALACPVPRQLSGIGRDVRLALCDRALSVVIRFKSWCYWRFATKVKKKYLTSQLVAKRRGMPRLYWQQRYISQASCSVKKNFNLMKKMRRSSFPLLRGGVGRGLSHVTSFARQKKYFKTLFQKKHSTLVEKQLESRKSCLYGNTDCNQRSASNGR